MRRVKSLFVAASIVAIVVGSVQIASTYFKFGKSGAPATRTTEQHLGKTSERAETGPETAGRDSQARRARPRRSPRPRRSRPRRWHWCRRPRPSICWRRPTRRYTSPPCPRPIRAARPSPRPTVRQRVHQGYVLGRHHRLDPQDSQTPGARAGGAIFRSAARHRRSAAAPGGRRRQCLGSLRSGDAFCRGARRAGQPRQGRALV